MLTVAREKKKWRVATTASILLALTPINTYPSYAATVTATGTNPSVCNQTVGDGTNVIAYRLSGGDCVIEFKNAGTTTWDRPAGVTTVRVLVVGGGGGGASRHAGGGGGGGVVEATSYVVSGTVGITVGSGGSAGLNQSKGASGTDSRLYLNTESSAGATGLVAKGGGFGDFYTVSGNAVVRAGSGGSGGGAGVRNPFTRDLSAGYTNADPTGLTIQSSQTQRNFDGTTLSANMSQYGNNGAQGGLDSYWSGGGGGGAGSVGSRGGGDAGTNYTGGAGGAGIESLITSTSRFFGGGGGGGGGTNGVSNFAGGAGGSGGGGAGSAGVATATSGTANTGGGGGGGGLRTDGLNGPGGAGGSGIVIVRYTPDVTAPTMTGPSSATGSTSTISISENATAVHTFTANESVTWSKSGIDATFFTISSGGVLTISSRDYEIPTDSDVNNTYIVTISAIDPSLNVTTQTLTLTVTNVNEVPVISTYSSVATYAITQAENLAAVASYSGSDVDAGTTLTWSISGTDAGDFSIDSTSGVLTFASGPDFENRLDSDANNIYQVVVTLSDGSLTDTQTLTITISNENESAQLSAPSVSGEVNKGVTKTVTVTVNVAGKVRFFIGGKRISGCLARSTSGSYPNFTATCSWKPAVSGRQFLTATVTPTDNTFSGSTSARGEIFVLKRSGAR